MLAAGGYQRLRQQACIPMECSRLPRLYPVSNAAFCGDSICTICSLLGFHTHLLLAAPSDAVFYMLVTQLCVLPGHVLKLRLRKV